MTSEKQPSVAYNKHAIQLVALEVLELSIKRNPEYVEPDQPDAETSFSISRGHSEYDQDEHKIGVTLSVEIGLNQEMSALPFILRAEILGIFDVDESKFPILHIKHWAENNAPLVLYPYLREQVHGLTIRAGQPGLLLPLFEVPTFKINPVQT